MKHYYILLGLLFTGLIAKSQFIQIIDKSDKQSIQNAMIYNSLKSKIATTDIKGYADISSFDENDTIIIKHISYQVLYTNKSDLIKNDYKVYLYDNIVKLEEFVLSANRYKQQKDIIPNKIDIINNKDISFQNPQTTADMLTQSGKVFVQQSQLGGGSPILRGFEANRVLIVVDGVRMNNAIYRSGHLQSIITIDPNIIERTEILYGPGSVIYGSDALGGVMHIYTKEPMFSKGKSTFIKGSGFMRFSTASNENTIGANVNIGLQKLAFIFGITYKELHDLKSGKQRNPFYEDWGKCKYYTMRINNVDSVIQSSHENIQQQTGYKQYDVLGKLAFKANEYNLTTLNFQYSNTGNINRYDRLQQFNADTTPNYSEWYYGPQKRLMISLKHEYKKSNLFFDNANFNIAYQYIQESRIQRKYNDNSREYRIDDVDIASANFDFQKNIGSRNVLYYGIEGIFNYVKSKAYAKNIVSDNNSYNIASRYPDNGNFLITASAFVTHNWKICKMLDFSQGVRFSIVSTTARYTDTAMKIMKFPFDKDFNQTNMAINGSLGLIFKPGYDWKIALFGSSGFRNPNIDDLGKVNDSKGKNRLIVVPNFDLKPEYAYNADFTIGKTFMKKVQIEATAFYTYLIDAIAMKPFIFNGEDSITYDGKLCQVQANSNSGRAYVYGLQASLLAQITTSFSISSSLTYTKGWLINDDKPLDHTPPIYGITTFRLELNDFKAEFYVMYNGWKYKKDYNLTGEDNFETATIYGTPSWYTLNLKAAYQINPYVSIQLGVENILDVHYRVFASGISAPGRNFIFSLRAGM